MNINHTKMTLEINSCKNYEILEVRQGDKGSRIIDFAFTVNGETVNLASTMSAKVNATVDDVIVADSVAAVVDTENNVVTVTLTDAMLALSGICKMDIVLTEGDEIITAETVCLRVGKSVINDDSKAFPGASSIAEITKEVENARGSSNSLGARLDKTDKSIARKLDSMPFDSEPKNNSPCYLTSGTVYSALLVKADKTTLATKYDSSNIESGTSTLTPYSTVADKIKSANCTYKTIGDIVIVSATVKMNAVSLAGNSMCPLIDLPYKCISEDNVFCVGISNLGKLFKFAIPKNNTWLQFSTQDKTVYTFADGEQINVICLYKIK
ncbi:MAG: BppU family phage baseplate upper protein [Ruminococcus sp.]